MARVMRQIVRAASVHAWGRARACTIEHPINELVQYVLSLTDIIYANEHGKKSWDVLKWDVLKSVGRKYEKGKLCVSVLRTVKSRRGKLVKYKAINELVRVGAITPMNWYAITPMNWYAWGRSRQ